MESFCGDGTAGALIRTDCRTDLFIVVINCAFVLDCICVFLWKIARSKPAADTAVTDGESIVVRFREHNSRWVLSLCFVLVTWCDISEAVFTAQISNQYPLSAFMPPCLSLLSAIMSLIYYNKLEFWKLYKPLLLLLAFWGASLLLRLIKLVQLYNMGFGIRHLCVDVSVAYLVVFVMLLVVEVNLLWSQKYMCGKEVKSTERQYNVSDLKYLHDSSNVLSKCIFWWINPLLWTGYKHPLELQDLGLLPQQDHVERQFERFNEVFLQEKEKAEAAGKPVSLWRCFFKAFWPMLTLSGVFKLLSDLVGYIGPLSIGIIIKFVNARLEQEGKDAEKFQSEGQLDDVTTVWAFLQNGYVMAAIVLIATMFQSTFCHISIQMAIVESIHLRSCIQTLVYNKCLRMSTWQATGSVDVGAIINHVSSDAFNVMMLFMMGHFIWAIPLQVTTLLVLLCLQLGYSALIGAASVALFIPIQFVISKTMSKLQKKILAVTDWRLKKTSELLDGMKLLKLYAWEKLFGEEIHAIREKELKLLIKDAMCWSSNSFLTQVSSIVLTLVTFALYSTMEGKALTPEEVFTSLALFGQLAVPLFLFPIVVPIVINAVVSTKRLTSFLSLSDVNYSTIKHIDAEGSTILEFEADSGSIVLHIKEHKPDKSKTSFRDSEVFLCDSDDDLEGDRNVAVEMKNASFTWDGVNKEPMLHNVTTEFPASNLTIIVGSVGSGKTSLLSAVLGEMCMLEGTVKWSRNSPVGYVPQKPWLINASLRDNILFGQAYDARRFGRVISACALQVDIDLLPGGEQTEIGEKGVNLSGGQKQRIAIARALYSRCKTLVLDDPFSALDAQVGLHVFEEGVKKLLLRYKRTVILVTHRLQFLSQASKIIFMENGAIKYQGSFDEIASHNSELCNRWKATMNREEKECKQEGAGDGTAQERHKLARLLSQRSTSVVEDAHPRSRALLMQRQISCDTSHPFPVHDCGQHLSDLSLHHSMLSLKSQRRGSEENFLDGPRNFRRMISVKSTISHEVPEEGEEQDDNKPVDETAVQLISKEERERGSVSLQVFLTYIKACGWPFCSLVLFAAVSTQAISLGKDFWLSAWSSASKREKDAAHPDDEFTDDVLKLYLPVYAALSVLAIILSLCTNVTGAYTGLRAQRQLHYSMLDSIVQAPMRFFDTNLAGRILNRFSADIGVLDKKVAVVIQLFLRFVLLCLSAIIVNIVVSVYFLIIVIPIFVVYYVIQKFFRYSSRELQRLDSITKSPIFAHFSETVSGLTTIRAFRDESRFKEKFAFTINTNNLTFLFITAANRWLGIALDYLGGIIVFVATVAAITAAMYGAIPPGFVGLAMAYSLLIPIYLNWVVRHAADTEMAMSGVERISQYVNISTEAYDGNKEPPAEWPFSGEIRMENVSLRYDEALQPVLSKVSLMIKPGEKVGICGRTGSGKSSLTLGLFRMIDVFEGSIYVDDVDITKVPLLTLRSRLAIIPQESVMFTGTLRLNLDPEGLYSESELWDVLEKAQLKDVVQNMSHGLDTQVSQGDNFSIGQRQLFCLARAILRKSKIVVMDEATASLDSETDRIVQKVMSDAFADCTVLTIAHRISSILHYNTIVVLDSGNIVEFGPPSELLKKPGSIFLSLVKANK